MRTWMKSIAIGFAWALCCSALADDRVEHNVPVQYDEPSPFAEKPSRPLDDEQLARLRGRMASPADLQQAGVVLWDEPRKGLPPVRGVGEAPSASNVSTSFTIHLKSP